MSTTFNGLVLDELGTIGNPQIEYANFIATTASPAGYDGAVLRNFKRDYTTIQFDLTLAGTESECLNKLNTLAGALNAGQGELVMPGQAERGTHFNAVPNMKIKHSLRGFDGMTVPCTFIVPEGCAVSEYMTATVTGINNVTEFDVGGFLQPDWSIDFGGVINRTTGTAAAFFEKDSFNGYFRYDYLLGDLNPDDIIRTKYESATKTLATTVNGSTLEGLRNNFEPRNYDLVQLGSNSIRFYSVYGLTNGVTATLSWQERSVW